MTNRYKVVRKNTLYYIYDNESKRYIESHFVFESDAVVVCEELNRKAEK